MAKTVQQRVAEHRARKLLEKYRETPPNWQHLEEWLKTGGKIPAKIRKLLAGKQ